MAGVVHISEAEAARDFAAVMRRVRAGDEVVVENGGRAVAVLRPASSETVAEAAGRGPGKTTEEVVARLREWEREHGPLRMGADFADDVEQIHREYNQPMKDPWG